MGKAYFPPDHLKEESKRRFSENMFDIVVSDQVALNRAMPDIRNDESVHFLDILPSKYFLSHLVAKLIQHLMFNFQIHQSLLFFTMKEILLYCEHLSVL